MHIAPPYRAARARAGGFTLVELLVVIGIIAVLAAVVLPGVTGALRKAKENGAMQTGRSLALAAFQYSNDNGAFPTGSTSTIAFESMSGYISNTDALFLPMTGKSKYTGNAPSTGLQAANNCWDMTNETSGGAATATGLTTSDPDSTPFLMSTGWNVTYGAVGTGATATGGTAANSPFGTDGLAVSYRDCSAAFKTAPAGTTPTVTISSLSFGQPTGTTYAQIKP